MAFGSVDVAPAVDDPAAVSFLTAWKRACMNWPMSFLTLLVADVDPSESPSPSITPVLDVVPDVAVTALVPVVAAAEVAPVVG